MYETMSTGKFRTYIIVSVSYYTLRLIMDLGKLRAKSVYSSVKIGNSEKKMNVRLHPLAVIFTTSRRRRPLTEGTRHFQFCSIPIYTDF